MYIVILHHHVLRQMIPSNLCHVNMDESSKPYLYHISCVNTDEAILETRFHGLWVNSIFFLTKSFN